MYDVSTEPQRTSAPSTHKIVLNAVPPTTFAMRPGLNSYLTVIQQSARLFHALPRHIHHNIFIYQLVHGYFTVSFGYKCQTDNTDHTEYLKVLKNQPSTIKTNLTNLTIKSLLENVLKHNRQIR